MVNRMYDMEEILLCRSFFHNRENNTCASLYTYILLATTHFSHTDTRSWLMLPLSSNLLYIGKQLYLL